MLTTFLTVIHVIVCVFLILVVLLQQGKGGGLSSMGGGGAQVFGGRGAGNFMTRLTAICATVFMFTSLTLAALSSAGDTKLEVESSEEAPGK
jgi:preprotein translocase subunit SecG